VKYEGKVPHFYLDPSGLVTIGIGCRVATIHEALQLDFLYKDSKLPAERDSIRNDFIIVSQSISGQDTSYYDLLTNLFLSEEDIVKLFIVKYLEKLHYTKTYFADFDSFSDNIKLALLDMTFNLGVTGLIMKFPKFTKALQRKDWMAAAAECDRHGISAERNSFVRNTFLNEA